jgi:phosphorylcholine metabolism protein LicD
MIGCSVVNLYIDVVDCIYERLIAKPKQVQDNHTLIWFGDIVSHIAYLQKYLKEKGFQIHYVADNNPNKWGKTTPNRLLILPPSQVINKYKDNALILVLSRHKDAIYEQLKTLGIPDEQIIVLPTLDWFSESNRELNNKLSGLRKMEYDELQLCMLNTLKEFKKYCDANKLTYFLSNGTLIGAVRHQGFIPWDDEIDVYMPLEDYNRFFSAYPNEGVYRTIDWRNDHCYHKPAGRFVDTRTIHKIGKHTFRVWLLGVGISIMPLAGYPDTQEGIEQKLEVNRRLRAGWYELYYMRGLDDSYFDCREDIWELQYDLPYKDASIVGLCNILHIQGKEYATFAIPKIHFSESVLLKFEDDYFSAPIGYDFYLRTLYGDYMQLPPESERRTHGYPAYWEHKE